MTIDVFRKRNAEKQKRFRERRAQYVSYLEFVVNIQSFYLFFLLEICNA